MITYRASKQECLNSLQSQSSHHILNVLVVVVVGWGSVRSCRSFWRNRINTVQMLRLCAAAVERRAPVSRDSHVSSWRRLLHLPPLRLLMGNDFHVFMHTRTCRMSVGPHVEYEHTRTCAGRARSGYFRNHKGYFTFFVVTFFSPSSLPQRTSVEHLALAKFINMVTDFPF